MAEDLTLDELEVSDETTQDIDVGETLVQPPDNSDLVEFTNAPPEFKEEQKEEAKESKVENLFYTEEEFNEILESDGKFDAKRLSPAHKAIQKSFEKHYQKKYQEVAELKRQTESANQQKQAESEGSDRDKWKNAYKENPVAVLNHLNKAIEQAETVDPWDEKYKEARLTIARINAFKDELQAETRYESENIAKIQQASNAMLTEVTKAIPDFAEKQSKLTEFAIAEYDFTNEELAYLTSPAMGKAGIKLIKAINKAYTQKNAGKTAEAKRVKQAPPKITNDSQGAVAPKKSKANFSSMPRQDFEQMMNDVAMGRTRIA